MLFLFRSSEKWTPSSFLKYLRHVTLVSINTSKYMTLPLFDAFVVAVIETLDFCRVLFELSCTFI